MGIFGRNKDDNENKGRKGRGPKPMNSQKKRYKSRKELKPLIKQAESEAKKFNFMKHVGKAAADAAIQGGVAGATAGVVDAETKYMPIVDREKMTDEEYYDRGDYERSYGPGRKYGHPEKPSAARKGVMDADTEDMPVNTDEKKGAYIYKPPHAAQKRMGDMVAKVYGKVLPPSQQRTPTKAEKKQQYTTSGSPKYLYTEQGDRVNTMNIDEGNLSAIHRVHKLGEHVTVQDDTERFGKGTKLFLNNPMGDKTKSEANKPMGARKFKMPPSMNKKPKKGGKAEAVKNTPKPPTGQRPR